MNTKQGSFPVKEKNSELEFVLELWQLETERFSLPTAPTSVGETECVQCLQN